MIPGWHKVNHQKTMRQLITAIVIAIIAIIFALQNNILVTVRLIFWDLPYANLALVLVLTIIMGIVIGLLFLAPGIYKRNQTISAQKKRIAELERDINIKKPI